MPKNSTQYTTEYRREIVALARRSSRSPEALAREVEPSAGTIRNWIRQADLDEGRRTDGITTKERTEIRRLRRATKRLRLERDIVLLATGWFRGEQRLSPQDGFAFVKAHRNILPVRAMCRILGSSSSGYYAWLKRPPSLRARRDAVLRRQVHLSWKNSRRTYGRRRIHADLRARGERVSQKRIARLMREMGISGASHRRKKMVTARRSTAARPAPDLVNGDFRASTHDELWVADITHVPTQAGWLYVAVVLDAWSRSVVGLAAATHVRTELVEQALAMAVQRRRPTDVVHHSDRGTQYTSRAFGQRCRAAGVRPSMGSAGNPCDNALCESFFATLERELLGRRRFASPAQARAAVTDFIAGFYNPRRRHSALGYCSPAEFERNQAP